ncbi:hypothetical protein BDZ91DRAFT_41061 [Kalaharituber pfeilii]|nr:hypothetical protein BDZ91DRAFT_41061 [Kalaharituber pfeilii]
MGKLHDVLPLHPTSDSLIVVTSTLGAPSTWLAQSYVAENLRPQPTQAADIGGVEGGVNGSGRGVVLVSFVTEERVWREGIRRGMGVDISLYIKKGKFAFVDGLTRLFEDAYIPRPPTPLHAGGLVARPVTHGRTGPIPPRDPMPSMLPTPPSQQQDDGAQIKLELGPDGKVSSAALRTGVLGSVANAIKAVEGNGGGKPLVVVDGIDFLLSAAEAGAWELWEVVMDIRELSHALLLFISADTPLLHPATSLSLSLFHHEPPPTPRGPLIETSHSAFLTTAVHNATIVVSLRLLDTGVAKDVSGVMRVTIGGDGEEEEEEWGGKGQGREVEEKEVLYYVADVGGVEVFDRGEMRR